MALGFRYDQKYHHISEKCRPDQEIKILPTYDGTSGLLRQEGGGYAMQKTSCLELPPYPGRQGFTSNELPSQREGSCNDKEVVQWKMQTSVSSVGKDSLSIKELLNYLPRLGGSITRQDSRRGSNCARHVSSAMAQSIEEALFVSNQIPWSIVLVAWFLVFQPRPKLWLP